MLQVVVTLASVAVIFIPIGLVCLFASAHVSYSLYIIAPLFLCVSNCFLHTQVVEIEDRYDSDCIPSNDTIAFIQSSETNKTCFRTL